MSDPDWHFRCGRVVKVAFEDEASGQQGQRYLWKKVRHKTFVKIFRISKSIGFYVVVKLLAAQNTPHTLISRLCTVELPVK